MRAVSLVESPRALLLMLAGVVLLVVGTVDFLVVVWGGMEVILVWSPAFMSMSIFLCTGRDFLIQRLES